MARSTAWSCLLLLLLLLSATTSLRGADAEQLEYFETKVRPVLAEHCFGCHSATAKSIKGGLRLDSNAGLRTGGDSGQAIDRETPADSLLLQAVRYEAYEMPPQGKLRADQIAALTQWVSWGAPWPAEPVEPQVTEEGYDWQQAATHWAWQPLSSEPVPRASGDDWVVNPIDHFVVRSLREQGLTQASPADPWLLVRRAFLDLNGIPPTPLEMDEWRRRLEAAPGRAQDEVMGQLVDYLLDRPQYGERWGRHWLDVARYSDVGGWSQDNRARPSAYRYRDWVVDAFNRDLPYDEFVRQQIAGDSVGSEQAIGTGFFALGPHYSSDGGDPDSIAQARGETLDDRVDTFSRAFLGLTVSCARCHDHKFDPIPTQDYYSLAGIFQNSGERDQPLATSEVVQAYHHHQDQVKAASERIKKLRHEAKRAKRELSADEQQQLETWQQELDQLKQTAPPKYPVAHVIHDTGSKDMHVALRGNLLKPGEVAPRRFLRILAGESRSHFQEGSGRHALAHAVTAPTNPLAARVYVNRVWLQHFGRALVGTPSNFGKLGELPSHPQLLDWLARHFVDSGWSIKRLHRLIMTSATYRSSSQFDAANFERDSDNRYLWRMSPRRMDVETWRDSLLTVTGELDRRMGGPAIDNITSSRRRTLYAKISRNDPASSDKFLRLFDFPVPRATSPQRTADVIPQQFLFMLNSPFMADRARALRGRLEAESGSQAERVAAAYRLLYGRQPSGDERQAAERFLTGGTDGEGEARWQRYCQVLLSANEFMYIR